MSKTLTKRVFFFVLSFLAFVSAAILFMVNFDVIYSWMASNTKVRGGASDVSVRGDFAIDLEMKLSTEVDWHHEEVIIVEFDKLYPGTLAEYKQTVDLRITNNEQMPMTMSVAFAPIDGYSSNMEVPAVVESMYYYFGSQICVSNISASKEVNAVGKGKFLMTTQQCETGVGQVNGVSERITSVPGLPLVGDFAMAAGETIMIDFEFEFVDNLTDQNVFRTFADFDELSCSRMFYVFAA